MKKPYGLEFSQQNFSFPYKHIVKREFDIAALRDLIFFSRQASRSFPVWRENYD